MCNVTSAVPSLSKIRLKMLDAFRYSGMVWGLRNWTYTGGIMQCMCRAFFQNCIKWSRYWSVLSNIVACNCDLKIIHWSYWVRVIINAISLISTSILSLSIFTRNPAAVYALSNVNAKYFFCPVSHTQEFMFFFQIKRIRSDFFPKHSRGRVMCIKYFSVTALNIHCILPSTQQPQLLASLKPTWLLFLNPKQWNISNPYTIYVLCVHLYRSAISANLFLHRKYTSRSMEL